MRSATRTRRSSASARSIFKATGACRSSDSMLTILRSCSLVRGMAGLSPQLRQDRVVVVPNATDELVAKHGVCDKRQVQIEARAVLPEIEFRSCAPRSVDDLPRRQARGLLGSGALFFLCRGGLEGQGELPRRAGHPVVLLVSFVAFQEAQHMKRLQFPTDGASGAVDAAIDLVGLRVRVGGDVEQDLASERRDAIAGAADSEAHGALIGYADRHRSADQLRQLLCKPGRHFR